MTHATPTTKTKKDNRRYCANCGKRFRFKTAKEKYCKESCRTARNNKRRRVDPIAKAMGSKFFYYIAKECIRAGTYEILLGHNLESLGELYKVYTLAHRANQFSQVEDYAISHICPVKGQPQVGLLHSHNLVVSPTGPNRAHGTNHFGEGKGIDRSKLKDFLKVNPNDKESQVKEKAIAFLGRDLVTAFVKTHKIDVASSIKDRQWINEHADLNNPEHLEIYELAQQAKGKEVSDLRRELKALIDEAPVKPGFKINVSSMSVARVLIKEWIRYAAIRPEIAPYLESFKDATQDCYFTFSDEDTQTVFDLLHGKSVDEMEICLETLIARHTLSKETSTEILWWDDIFGEKTDEEIRLLRQYADYADRVQEQADALAAKKKVGKRVVEQVVTQAIKQAGPFRLNITQPEILTRDLDELAYRRREERRLAAVVSLPVAPVQTPVKRVFRSFAEELDAKIASIVPVNVPVFTPNEVEDDEDDDYGLPAFAA